MNWLGRAALLIVVGRTIGLIWPEPKPWMYEAGELAHDAALAFLVGYFFNLLVVEWPRIRDRQRVEAALQNSISRLANSATRILDWMWSSTHGMRIAKGPNGLEMKSDEPPPNEYTQAVVEELCGKLHPHDSAASISVTDDGKFQVGTWLEFLVRVSDDAQAEYEKLLPFAGLLKVEMVTEATAIEGSDFHRSAHLLANWKISDENLTAISNHLWEYYEACRGFAEVAGIERSDSQTTPPPPPSEPEPAATSNGD